MAECEHNWKSVTVIIVQHCVTLKRCEKCKKFANVYGLVTEPPQGSIQIDATELSEDFREFLEDFIKVFQFFPTCSPQR